MRQEFCLNHSSGLNAQNILSRILDQARLTGGLPKPVFLTFLSVAPVYHARVEARPKIMGILDGANIFQSTRPRGARRTVGGAGGRLPQFQSTRPHGARLLVLLLWLPLHHFNPRARVGRDRTTWYFAPTLPHFNPRAPCGARLTMEELASLCARISIHTPRMGARRQSMRIKNSPEAISIHAPTRGATSHDTLKADRQKISIHAPAWGATKA